MSTCEMCDREIECDFCQSCYADLVRDRDNLKAAHDRLRKAAAWVLNPGLGLDALKAAAELAAALAALEGK